eukprot:6190384-Pleurochrysis_carterae.AAC.1
MHTLFRKHPSESAIKSHPVLFRPQTLPAANGELFSDELKMSVVVRGAVGSMRRSAGIVWGRGIVRKGKLSRREQSSGILEGSRRAAGSGVAGDY